MSNFSIKSKKFLIESENSSIDSSIFRNIIKKVNPKNLNIDENNEELIIIDVKTGKPQNQDGFVILAKSFMGRKYDHYVISWADFSKVDRLICEISDPKNGTTIKLHISFEVSCIEQRGEDVLLFFKNKINESHLILERAITNWIRNFISQHPNFIADFFNLEGQLGEHIIKQASRNIGLRIRSIRFNPTTNPIDDFPPEHITIVHSTNCEIIDDYIEVKNKIVLNLFNKRAFSWKNIDDPEVWIKQKIDAIIQNELINKSFRDIVDEFKSGFKKNISTKLDLAVKEIGYSVQHIISVPSEEIANFLSGFTFNLGDRDTFETSEAEIKIRLSVTVEAKGTQLNGIDKKYIKPRKSIIDEVRKSTLETINAKLRRTNPETYYSKPNDVSNAIKSEIRNALFKNFKLDENDFRIAISFLNTDLKERFDALFAERGMIRIDSKSEDTCYEISYGIQAVNDWYIFHKNHIKYYENTALEYIDISNSIKNEIELNFKNYESTIIKTLNTQNLDEHIKNSFRDTQYIITEDFGIQLGSPRLKRIIKSDIYEGSILIEALSKRKKKIAERLAEAIMADGDEDEMVEELTEELKKIGTRLKNLNETDTKLLGTKEDSDIQRINNNEEEEGI